MYEREFLVESYYNMYKAWEEEKTRFKESEEKWKKIYYSQLVVNMVLGSTLVALALHVFMTR